MIMVNYLFF